ncbi:MAG: hypothetical protein SPI09_02485 [Candidatus Limivicinus sp.]|nr:hypothetical protein [Clostridiales bacterium]MDY6132216.1 hypothetical protein [Candidatus Limivicinus sp.]
MIGENIGAISDQSCGFYAIKGEITAGTVVVFVNLCSFVIARALLRGSTVLLADEATADLDAETARTVTDSLLNLKGLTRVVVTHRLEPSALSRYDGIIVMKNGRVSEQGSFDGLMEAKNQFYALFMLANG